jgi:hypothetical protein
MKVITRDEIEECEEKIALYDSDELMAEVRNFSSKQRDLFAYLLYAMKEMSDEAFQLGLYLAFLIWKLYPENLSPVDMDIILKMLDGNIEWVKRYSELKEDEEDEIRNYIGSISQPILLKYILDSLFIEFDEGRITIHEYSFLFVTLKTVMDILDMQSTSKV